MLVLAIETSCDETAVAVLRGCGELLASEIASQAAAHAAFGGVVPEVASRNHLELLPPLAAGALAKARVAPRELTAIVATGGPGLAPALLVGMAFGKALAIGLRKPFHAVNHIEGHLLSPFFGGQHIPRHLALVVSGGHTLLVSVEGYRRYRVLGRTLDDAAGEALDKTAKLLGLPYPGGPAIEQLALQGSPGRFPLPRAMRDSGDLNFSFSGLKTAARYLLEREPPAPATLPDLCADFQNAVFEALVSKTLKALGQTGHSLLAVSGGVSSNAALRERLDSACAAVGAATRYAPRDLRTDNAAMIAHAGSLAAATDLPPELDRDVISSLWRDPLWNPDPGVSGAGPLAG